MKVGVARVDATDAMFPHQDCGVRVMHQVSANERQLSDSKCGDLLMPLAARQHAKRR